jgi:hypothetical protein
MVDINWTNASSSIQGFVVTPNTATGGWFWTGMLWMLIIIIFLGTINFGFEVALMFSCFAALLIGVPLMIMGLVSTWVIGIFIGLFLFSVVLFMFMNPKNN